MAGFVLIDRSCNLMVYKLPLITVKEDETLTIRLLQSSTRPLKAPHAMCFGSPQTIDVDIET
jgi:hypothetical protein